MKNNNKTILISGILLSIIILVICLVYNNVQSTKPPTFSKEFQKVIVEDIKEWNIQKLAKHSDETINTIAPIGKKSQMNDDLSKKEKVRKYVNLYKKERKKQEKFYRDNTEIKQDKLVHNKDSNTYTQYLKIDSYSLTGYSIVYNDLLWFGTNLLSNEYTKKGVTKEEAESFDEVDAKFRTYAIVKTNEHLDSFDEKFTTTVELTWYFNKEKNKWMCTNMDTALNNLFDPEKISLNETTGLFGKYHEIASKIMDEIIEHNNFDELNPFDFNNIKKSN